MKSLAPVRARLSGQRGFALVELLVAVLISALGLVALVGALGATRNLTTLSERKEAGTQVAEKELERIQAMSYDQIGLASAPTTSADPNDPRSRVSGGNYTWKAGAAAEPLDVDASGGTLVTGPEPWQDGRSSGNVYRFVTWVDDPRCGVLCPGTQDLKRVTVAVTMESKGSPRKAIVLSSLVQDPNSGPLDGVVNGLLNPLNEPDTQCLNNGTWGPCAGSVIGNALTYFPYDTDATASSARQPIAGNHATHPTVAPTDGLLCNLLIVVTGCPKPDLMGTTPPPSPADPLQNPPLYNYSSELIGNVVGGRMLQRDTSCTGTPSQNNLKSEMWTTPALSSATTLTGEGGLTLYSQTVDSVPANVKLCVRFYDVPNSILNLISTAPTALGTASYSLASWPTTAAPVSFTFDFLPNNVTIAAGRRIGMRIWVDSSSGADIAAIYDHPSYATSLQLTEASG